MATPFLIVGDGPNAPTGLGRIARDLAGLLRESDLDLDLVQVGGAALPVWRAWTHVPLDPRNEDWGASQVQAIWHQLWGRRPGILLTVWDPGRLLPYAQIDLPAQKWAYVAIDAENSQGRIGGPAAAALAAFDRVLAYGRWGAEVLKVTLGQPIQYLPHGLSLATYAELPTDAEQAWVTEQVGPYRRAKDRLIGCVMTNQFRKDFGLYMQLLARLQQGETGAYGWVHTDEAVKAWALAELVETLGLQKRLTVSLDTWTDRQIALMYQACDVTVLPSLGEGFGYPIVESLAAGRPSVHSDCAGGAELVPKTEWRVPVRLQRLEGIYALKRPVMQAEDWANATRRALRWQEETGQPTAAAYCRGAVAHLDWRQLWPRWRGWVRQGLEG